MLLLPKVATASKSVWMVYLLGRATSRDGNRTCHVGKVQRIFNFRSNKSYSVIPYSAFYRLSYIYIYPCCSRDLNLSDGK